MAAFPGLQYEIDVDIQLVGVSFPRRGWTLFIASDQQTFPEAMGKYAISIMSSICRDRLPKETLLRN